MLAILWSYRLVIAAALIACLLGGAVTFTTASPRYLAKSRVVLEIAKPDPITGAVVNSKQLEAYINTQARMITGLQVAATAVENLGWTTDPELQAIYSMNPPENGQSLLEWVARRVAANTTVAIVPETNILEIGYRGDSPEVAVAGALAIRDAYIQINTATLRNSAQERVAAIEQQISGTRARITELDASKAALERETGVILSDEGDDIENAGLGELSRRLTLPTPARASYGITPGEQLLMQLDAAIASASRTLGPNNPQLQGLMQQRSVVLARVAAARAHRGAVTDTTTLASVALQAKMAEISSQRVDATRLRMVQDESVVARADYNTLAQRLGEARQLSRVSSVGLTPVGTSELPKRPEFPRPELVFGGTGAIGGFVGVLLALLMEFFNRRVRSKLDLAHACRAPVLMTVRRVRRRRRLTVAPMASVAVPAE